MNIIDLYEKYFDDDYKKVFEQFSNYDVYLVGGPVRDMLLKRSFDDIDITFNGNATELAKKINCEILSVHEDFGTVKIKINNKIIDLASTRKESYPQKGHLPVVTEIGCSLRDDVLRRDFSVNSLAMSLNKKTFAEVIDYTGGLNDLKTKTLRILHSKSFVDDPSRILRGFKYSSRLGFSYDEETLNLQKHYLSSINYDMSYKRILQEFYKTEWSIEVFNDFINQNIYKLINPEVKNDFDFWFSTKNPFIYFALLLPDNRFELNKKDRSIIEKVKEFKEEPKNDFETYKTFNKEPLEFVQILSIMKKSSAKIYLQRLKDIKILTTGKDLINMGFEPSKSFQEIFDFLISKKLKNPNMTKEDELKLISSILF